jgi:hypothetical protein
MKMKSQSSQSQNVPTNMKNATSMEVVTSGINQQSNPNPVTVSKKRGNFPFAWHDWLAAGCVAASVFFGLLGFWRLRQLHASLENFASTANSETIDQIMNATTSIFIDVILVIICLFYYRNLRERAIAIKWREEAS